MKFLPLLMMAVGAMVIGCERHDFDVTKELHDRTVAPSVDGEDADDHSDH